MAFLVLLFCVIFMMWPIISCFQQYSFVYDLSESFVELVLPFIYQIPIILLIWWKNNLCWTSFQFLYINNFSMCVQAVPYTDYRLFEFFSRSGFPKITISSCGDYHHLVCQETCHVARFKDYKRTKIIRLFLFSIYHAVGSTVNTRCIPTWNDFFAPGNWWLNFLRQTQCLISKF